LKERKISEERKEVGLEEGEEGSGKNT